MYKIENLMSMLFKLSTVIYIYTTCTCTFKSLAHSLKRQCTEKSKREIEGTQNNSSGKINVGIKRYTVMNHKGPARHTCTCKVA